MDIEAVTHLKARSAPYTSAEPKANCGGAMLVPISLARVRWLERPDLYPELEYNGTQPDKKKNTARLAKTR